jgi:hypothetical protein
MQNGDDKRDHYHHDEKHAQHAGLCVGLLWVVEDYSREEREEDADLAQHLQRVVRRVAVRLEPPARRCELSIP